jgi:flagellar protein FliS
MDPKGAEKYLRTKVLTATAEQLQMMLFDASIRNCEFAKIALEKKDYEKSYQSLTKAQAIVNQLICALKPDAAPDLCKKLKSLYLFAYKRLVDANLNHNINSLDEALNVLKYQRETWAMLMEQLGKAKAANVAAKMEFPSPNARMEASISMQG